MTEQFVFESSHVSALMDIGQARIALDGEAKLAAGDPAARFGSGYHDFVGGEPLDQQSVGQAIGLIMSQDQDCWSSILRASLMVAQGSEDHAALKANVQHLAVLATAWLEDINGRTPVGIEP